MPNNQQNNEQTDSNDQNNDNQNSSPVQTKQIVLGCDTNTSGDSNVINTVGQGLKQAGYEVEQLDVGPGPFSSYGYSGKAKGKVGIYLMAASLVSFADGTHDLYDYDIFVIRGDASQLVNSEEAFQTAVIPKDSDCNAVCNEFENMTYPQMNEKAQGKCVAVYGGTTPEEMLQAAIDALGGATDISGNVTTNSTGAQIKDKTFEDCIKRICAATDSIFIVENNAAVLFPYTDWMAFTLRHQISQIRAKDMDPDLFEIDYNTDGFYNKVTVVWGADEEQDIQSQNTDEEIKKITGNTTTIQKSMPTGGTQLSEQYDPLVNIYGELEKKVTTNFPNEETAHFVMNALLIQYIRDFNNSCRARVINNQKFVGGTFYAVENPNTNESELFYLNSYTMFKDKDQPLVSDMEFKYGPEGAEELLDYQTYGGGGGGSNNNVDSSTESAIWQHASKFCHFWTCPQLREAGSDATDPKQAEDYVNTKEQSGASQICLSCYGMSAWLYYQFNYKANIPCRVVGDSTHHVVTIFKNNAWYEPRNEYKQLDKGFQYKSNQNTNTLLEPPNNPNAQQSGNTNTSNGGGSSA